MPYLKFFIIFTILFVSSCTENIQSNGLTITKINQIKIKIGKTSKNDLISEYGPPVFQGVFNKNIVYYVSHKSSYLNFNPRTTKELVVLELTLDSNNIVKDIKKYSENDAKNINVSKMTTNNEDNKGILLRQMLDNIKRNATPN